MTSYRIAVRHSGWTTDSGFVVPPRFGLYAGLSGNGRKRRPKLAGRPKRYRTLVVAVQVMMALREQYPDWQYEVVAVEDEVRPGRDGLDMAR